jgi:aerobic carbon-monoxide dehydrogenase large subunit
MDYPLPRADDVPAIVVAGCESPSPLNALGIKGTGEGSAVPGPAAIANAVADALGAESPDLTDVPLRPQALARRA